ncbi:hypothetical protein AB3G45_08725 [Shinella sp. S4-D37]|uniref:hypothetical protein n=1 Tax=Shinella sp. S4-D37 TaxID=3161999 RepID=UPI003467423A
MLSERIDLPARMRQSWPLLEGKPMRLAGLFAIFAALSAVTGAMAQEVGGPDVPRTLQEDAQKEIARLRAIIRELEGEISDLRKAGAAPETSAEKADFKGVWVGNVSCGRRQFTITFSVSEQFGRVGKGKWEFSGAATGVDDAQISPMPTEETPTAYTIVTAKANTFDYIVAVDGNTITGKSTQQRCQLYLERG